MIRSLPLSSAHCSAEYCVHYPIAPAAMTSAFVLWSLSAFWRPSLWLAVVPALIPLIGFASWTGWLTFEEFDILVLGAGASTYLGWRRTCFRPRTGLGRRLMIASRLRASRSCPSFSSRSLPCRQSPSFAASRMLAGFTGAGSRLLRFAQQLARGQVLCPGAADDAIADGGIAAARRSCANSLRPDSRSAPGRGDRFYGNARSISRDPRLLERLPDDRPVLKCMSVERRSTDSSH